MSEKIDYKKAYEEACGIFHYLDVLTFEEKFIAPKDELEKWNYAKNYIRKIIDAGEVKDD